MLAFGSRESLLQEYNALPYLYKRILQFKTIFFVADTSDRFLYRLQQYTKLKNDKGKNFNKNECEQILQQLIDLAAKIGHLSFLAYIVKII